MTATCFGLDLGHHELVRYVINIIKVLIIFNGKVFAGRFQWPHGLRRGSMAARLLRLWVRVPSGEMDDCLL